MTDSQPSAPAAASPTQAWAREQLGIEPGDDRARMRAKFLARVEEEAFMPESADTQAWEILHGQYLAPTLPSTARIAKVDQALNAQVEQFAKEFFSLGSQLRAARYGHLLAAVGRFSPLRLRLKQLRPGLEVDTKSLRAKDADLQSLVEYLEELFVARPPERAAIMRRLRSKEQADTAPWRHNASRLAKAYPKIAALDRFAMNYLLREQLAWKAKNRVASPVPQVQVKSPSQKKEGTLLVLVVLAALAIVRIGASLSRESPKPVRPYLREFPRRNVVPSPDFTDFFENDIQRLRRKYNNENIIGETDTHILESSQGAARLRPKTDAEYAIDIVPPGADQMFAKPQLPPRQP